jgi:hypothetical protein
MAFSLGAQKVGINKETPKTTLDVHGAISSSHFLIEVLEDTVDIPSDYNLVILYNAVADSTVAILPDPPSGVTGQRLLIKNASYVPVFVPMTVLGINIPPFETAEFLLTSYDDWSFIGTSKVINEDQFWKIYGNTGTNPFYNGIGTIDSIDLTIKTSNVPRIQIGWAGNIGMGDYYQEDQLLRVKSNLLKTTGYFENNAAEFGDNGSSSAVFGNNLSYTNGNNYGGYFTSTGYETYGIGNNIGVAAIAENGANSSIGLYAAGATLAAHFDEGKVVVDESLGIGMYPNSNTRLEVDKPQYLDNAAKFHFKLDGKDNEVTIGKKLGNDFMGMYIDVEDTYDSIAIWAKGKAFILNDLAVGGAIVPIGYTMAVDGKIIAEEVRVQNSLDWPDYVFEEDYSLRPLKEVRAFIKENKHLPDVPSASEVDQSGIQLGEMQNILLRKVEELTLYLIDQQKEIEQLKHELAALRADQN